MAGSTPNFNHRYIYLLGIFYGFVTRGEHYGPAWPFHLVVRKVLFSFTFTRSAYHSEPSSQCAEGLIESADVPAVVDTFGENLVFFIFSF
jgi:hypothetical protein